MGLDYLAHIRTESSRFADALRSSEPTARVPSCPDWTADDLLYHLAEVYDFWTTVLGEGRSGEDVTAPERPRERTALFDLFDRSSAALLDVLTSTPGDQPMWSWVVDDVTADWLARRMAHEALIHRLDAELTAGNVTDFDAALAADGVAEVVHYFYGWRPSWARVHAGAVGRLTSPDTGDEWFVRCDTWSGQSPSSGTSYDGEPSLSLLAAPEEPSFSVQASARDLDVWLWNRPTLAEPVITGDASQLQALVAKGLQ